MSLLVPYTTRKSTIEVLSGATGFMTDDASDRSVLQARVVLLTHYVPLYQVRVFQEIARRVKDFQILLSTSIEPNRQFDLDWGDLNVEIQKAVTFRRHWRYRHGESGTTFSDPLYVHVPYDTQRRLKQLNPDIVMSLELGARSLGAIRYCQKHKHAKSILCTFMSEHTEVGRGRIRNRLRRYLVKRADALTFNGPSCKRYLAGLGVEEDRLYQLPYAADDRTIWDGELPFDHDTTRHRLIYVGQLSDRKGVVPMLRQLSQYCEVNTGVRIELRLAGDGPLRSTIEGLPTAENLTLKLLGNLSPQQLSSEMSRAGAMIAPTLADEWLLVVNEALHAGLPVIGSVFAQASTTLIRDGENGWQYNPCEEQSLDHALRKYFALTSEEVAEMRQKCRRSVKHRTPEWAASGVVRAIEDLTAQSQNSRRSDE